jgi:hypothetical protein
MDNRCLAAQLGLEDLACRLPRQHPHKCPERIVASRVNRFGRTSSNDWRSDGDEWAALSAAPNALLLASSAEGVFGAVDRAS